MRTSADPSAGCAGQRRRDPETAEPPHRGAASEPNQERARMGQGRVGAPPCGCARSLWLQRGRVSDPTPPPAETSAWTTCMGNSCMEKPTAKPLSPKRTTPETPASKQPHRLRRIGGREPQTPSQQQGETNHEPSETRTDKSLSRHSKTLREFSCA